MRYGYRTGIGILDAERGIRDINELRDAGRWTWDTRHGYRTRDTGYGTRDGECGMRDTGNGIWIKHRTRGAIYDGIRERDVGHEIWMRHTGYGTRDSEYGIEDAGKGKPNVGLRSRCGIEAGFNNFEEGK